MKTNRWLTTCILILIALAACTPPRSTPSVVVRPVATETLPTVTPDSHLVEVTRVIGTAEPTAPPLPTAVPNTNDLLTIVQNSLPANAFDGLAVLPLYVPNGEQPALSGSTALSLPKGPLWTVYSQGFRNYDIDPVPSHFVAIYTWQNNSWQELAHQELNNLDENNFGPDYLYEQGVTQVDIDPATVWLAIDGGVGAHGGTFQLLRFDGTALHQEVAGSSASPGLGYLEDLNGDGTAELILRLHDFYVFCYACGVRYLNFGVYTWDATNERMLEVALQPLPQTVQDHPAYQPNNRAIELANADLWPNALAQIEEAEQLATETAVSTNATILEWNAALIRLYNQAYQAELGHTPYSLLTNIFYGDYAAALNIMRSTNNEQLFSPTPPVIQGIVAEGNEQWLADYLLQQTNAAISVQPELASAYYFRAWATSLNNPADPRITADLQQAATLDPAEPLFSQAALPTANRIQFGAGKTAATVTGQLQAQGMDIYTLAAQAEQQMTVMLTTQDGEARITVLDGQGDFLDGDMSPKFWRGYLPETSDYVIRVYGGETAVSYTLQIIIPQRITFDPGAISATVAGNVAAHESNDYILAAQAGQTMTVNITSPNSNVLLTIVGADGIPLTNGLMSGATSWQGELPATQDYTLRAIGTLDPASYTLTVTIE